MFKQTLLEAASKIWWKLINVSTNIIYRKKKKREKENEMGLKICTERKKGEKREKQMQKKTKGLKIKRNMWTHRSLTNTYHQKGSVDSFVFPLSLFSQSLFYLFILNKSQWLTVKVKTFYFLSLGHCNKFTEQHRQKCCVELISYFWSIGLSLVLKLQ